MESLLRWGIENSSKEDEPQPPPRDISQLNPDIINHILGKSDAVKMKEELAIATDEKADVDARVTALDNFEMLIEQIDNANDIENMQMWEPIIKLLESTEEDIQVNALWIMGTAVQNNPKAQAAFLTHAPLPRVFDFLRSQEKTTSELKAKALYCISNVLKHNRTAVDQMEGLDGWKLLHDSLIDSNANVRRKTAFLFNSLLLPDGSAPHQPLTSTTNDLAIHAMEKHNVPSTLINAVTSTESATSDEDFEEKAARAILSFLEAGGRLNAEDATRLKERMKGQKGSSRWGLTREEWDSLLARSSQNT